jgi:hypothetical protein
MGSERKRAHTSEFLELVSVPTEPCFSIKTVDTPSFAWSLRAMARPTTPAPIMAWVKSAFLCTLVVNLLEDFASELMVDEIRGCNMVIDVEVVVAYTGWKNMKRIVEKRAVVFKISAVQTLIRR